MQKIVPHLWFDKEALEAAKWYITLFKNSKVYDTTTLKDTPSGDAQIVNFKLNNLDFSAISAGPYFSFNPSISLMVGCSTEEEVDRLYNELSSEGKVLMPIDSYPFCKRYSWVQDKYGLSWQIMLVECVEEHIIRPSLLFSREECGKAEEAIAFYEAVFKEFSMGYINHYSPEEEVDKRAKISYAEMNILGQEFVIMDHGDGGDFTFNEAFSFMLLCDSQEEIDYYWEKLSFVPEAEQCGWLKDKFGVSWQVVPSNMSDILMDGTEGEVDSVTEAFLKMKKLDIKALEKARKN